MIDIRIFQCTGCLKGFDLSLSNGKPCPKCGSGQWREWNALPPKQPPFFWRLLMLWRYKVWVRNV
jgi:hypothetical protein